MEQNMQINWDKFYRKTPIKEFDLNQTMYTLVKKECTGRENFYATGFMGNNKTYEEIFLNADLLAEAFTREQVREQDTIAILTVGIPIVQEVLLASSKIGATSAWMDLRAKEKEMINNLNKMNCEIMVVFEDKDIISKVKRIIDETDVKKVIVVSPADYLSPIERTLFNLKNKKEGKTVQIKDDKRFIRLKDFIKRDKIAEKMGYDLAPVGFEKERPSIIVGSSGSTGKPKQIIHTEYNFNSAVQKMAFTDLPFYSGNTMHISIPPFIIYGLGNSIYGSLAFAMKAEMNPLVKDDTVYNDLGEFDISLGAPLHYRYIYKRINDLQKRIEEFYKEEKLSKESKNELSQCLREFTIKKEGIERVKAFVSGGDKIGAEELLEMERLFERPIVNGYGNNECLGATIVSPMYANKPGSIGIPMKGVEIKIVDETGNTLAPHNIGELYVKTDSAFVEYLDNEEETRKIKKSDKDGEWISTGDLAYIDEDGYIIHKGRNKRLINKEAFKISPDTIENVIASIPFVKECVVVGVNDEKSGQLPMAFITLKDEFLDFEEVREEIENTCREYLPDYEIPSYYHRLEQIPYTPNEKQDFRLLESMAEEIVNQKKYVKK